MSSRWQAVAVFVLAVGCSAQEREVRDWRDASACARRKCAVRGTVVLQAEEDGVLRLYFDRERRDVSILLVRSLFASWPDYTGRGIVATGNVRRFRDQVEVVVSRQRDVEVGGAASSVTPDVSTPSPAAPPSPTDRATATPHAIDTPASDAEVERLRRQIDQLERRVRELEGER